MAIDTLEAWDVLLPEMATEFRVLRDLRNRTIHFRPDVDRNDRPLALAAITSLQSIVAKQFGAFCKQPWFIASVPGEISIKKDWKSKPFVRQVYPPTSLLVRPRHTAVSVIPRRIRDRDDDEDRDVSDDEFCALRLTGRGG